MAMVEATSEAPGPSAHMLGRSKHGEVICFDADGALECTGCANCTRVWQPEHTLLPWTSRRGGHLWLFPENPARGEDARGF